MFKVATEMKDTHPKLVKASKATGVIHRRVEKCIEVGVELILHCYILLMF